MTTSPTARSRPPPQRTTPPTTANNFHEFEIDSSGVVAGDNVLAVEVHQVSTTSSDLSFDLRLADVVVPPASGTVVATAAKVLQFVESVTATDAVDTDVDLTNDLPVSLVIDDEIAVVFTATDDTGNSTTRSVMVLTKIGPDLTVPDDITVVVTRRIRHLSRRVGHLGLSRRCHGLRPGRQRTRRHQRRGGDVRSRYDDRDLLGNRQHGPYGGRDGRCHGRYRRRTTTAFWTTTTTVPRLRTRVRPIPISTAKATTATPTTTMTARPDVVDALPARSEPKCRRHRSRNHGGSPRADVPLGHGCNPSRLRAWSSTTPHRAGRSRSRPSTTKERHTAP